MKKLAALLILATSMVAVFASASDADSGYVRVPNTICYVTYGNWYEDYRILENGQWRDYREHTARISAGNNPHCSSVSVRLKYVWGSTIAYRYDGWGYLYAGVRTAVTNRSTVVVEYRACDSNGRCGSFTRYNW
jgi:hypothetical protein